MTTTPQAHPTLTHLAQDHTLEHATLTAAYAHRMTNGQHCPPPTPKPMPALGPLT